MPHCKKSAGFPATLILAALAISTTLASAQTNQSNSLLTWTGATTPVRNYAGTVGTLIAIGGSPLTINALGVQDGGLLDGPTAVGLWSADGSTLLASTTVSSADPELAGGYRYDSVAPLTLQANTDYLIGAFVNATGFYDDGTAANYLPGNADVTMVNDVYIGGNSLSAPTVSGTLDVNRWGPANATFLSVPEPSFLALSAVAGLTGRLLRRRK